MNTVFKLYVDDILLHVAKHEKELNTEAEQWIEDYEKLAAKGNFITKRKLRIEKVETLAEFVFNEETKKFEHIIRY